MAFPVVLYGYTAHQFLFGIYTSMRGASPKRMITLANKVQSDALAETMMVCLCLSNVVC